MNNHPAAAELAAYVLGHHDAIDLAMIEAHVGECDECMDEVGREARLELLLAAAGREDAFAAVAPESPAPRRWPMVAAAAAVLACAAGGAGYALWRSDTTSGEVAASLVGVTKRDRNPGAPIWADGLRPGEARCAVARDGLICAASSTYRATREEAEAEAGNAAEEAMVDLALLRGGPAILSQRTLYFSTRRRLLASGDHERIRRARAIAASRVHLGARASWYWEEYNALSGDGTEVVVYVRLTATSSEIDAHLEQYRSATVVGAELVIAAPGIAWLFDPGERRAFFVHRPGLLATSGIRGGDVILLDHRSNADRMRALLASGEAMVWRLGLERPVSASQLR